MLLRLGSQAANRSGVRRLPQRRGIASATTQPQAFAHAVTTVVNLLHIDPAPPSLRLQCAVCIVFLVSELELGGNCGGGGVDGGFWVNEDVSFVGGGVVLWMLKSLRSSFLVRCELVEHRSLVLDNLTEVLG